jgi:hypothetical protein
MIIANVIQLVRKLFIFHKNVRSVSVVTDRCYDFDGW